jgi:hypothetical protein
LGSAVTVTAVWVLIVFCRRSTMAGGSPIAAALICFGLLFAAVVTLGRVGLGLAGATSSRYRTFDLLILVGLYLVALDRYDLRRGRTVANASEPVAQIHTDSVTGHRERVLARQRERTGLIFLAAFVALAMSMVVWIGVPEGLAGASADHAAQVRAARVTVNIRKYPNAFVNIALSEYLSAAFLRHMAQIAMADHLSLFATSDAARYRAEGLIVDPSNPVTYVAIPVSGAVLAGSRLLSATASDYLGVARVDFEVTGQGLVNQVVSHAQSYPYGWLGSWQTTTVPNGRYTLVSVAVASSGRTARSQGVDVVVENH